jgi:hypothetical protein
VEFRYSLRNGLAGCNAVVENSADLATWAAAAPVFLRLRIEE